MKNARLLLVDDTPDALRMMEVALRRYPHGWHLETAGSADEGLAVFYEAKGRDEPFDLLICDIAMPMKSGLMMVKELRESGEDVPVVFYSAYDGAINRQTAEDLGARDYIVKPISAPELLERIEKALAG